MNEKFFFTPLLNDSKSIMNSYFYWKLGKSKEDGLLEVSLKETPFNSDYTFLNGISSFLDYINIVEFKQNDVNFIEKNFPYFDKKYIEFIKSLNFKQLKIFGFQDSSVLHNNVPFLHIIGNLCLLPLVQYAIGILCGFPTLICTNSSRMRYVAGNDKNLLEFGLRRAQGPLAGLIGSKHAVQGCFDSTSNVYCGQIYNVPIAGTMAHAFIMSYQQSDDESYKNYEIKGVNLWNESLKIRDELGWDTTNLKELAAFISFVYIYPQNAMLLVDTYNTIHSGTKNFLIISLVLKKLGLNSLGIRLDSGDLAELSKTVRKLFKEISLKYGLPEFETLKISASNDINEKSLKSFNEAGHELDIFGIGTNLITCQAAPFLRFNKSIKISETSRKIPTVYTLYKKNNGSKWTFIKDFITLDKSESFILEHINKEMGIQDPFLESKTTLIYDNNILISRDFKFIKERHQKNYYSIEYLLKKEGTKNRFILSEI